MRRASASLLRDDRIRQVDPRRARDRIGDKAVARFGGIFAGAHHRIRPGARVGELEGGTIVAGRDRAAIQLAELLPGLATVGRRSDDKPPCCEDAATPPALSGQLRVWLDALL